MDEIGAPRAGQSRDVVGGGLNLVRASREPFKRMRCLHNVKRKPGEGRAPVAAHRGPQRHDPHLGAGVDQAAREIERVGPHAADGVRGQ